MFVIIIIIIIIILFLFDLSSRRDQCLLQPVPDYAAVSAWFACLFVCLGFMEYQPL